MEHHRCNGSVDVVACLDAALMYNEMSCSLSELGVKDRVGGCVEGRFEDDFDLEELEPNERERLTSTEANIDSMDASFMST